jgi:hypothetical protein
MSEKKIVSFFRSAATLGSWTLVFDRGAWPASSHYVDLLSSAEVAFIRISIVRWGIVN